MTTTATIAPPHSATSVAADWRNKPVVEMTTSELMAIAICRYPEVQAVPAIVELALRADRATRK